MVKMSQTTTELSDLTWQERWRWAFPGLATGQCQQVRRALPLICQLSSAGLCPQACPCVVSKRLEYHQHHVLPQLRPKTEWCFFLGRKTFPERPPPQPDFL